MFKPLIIDVEASGFGRGSYPIEVGLITPSGDTYCTIIRPEPEWQHWDGGAEALHGISREVLRDHGRPIVEVAALLNELLAGEVVYSDAWGNDSSWLGLLFDAAEMYPRFKLESLRSIMSEQQLQHWHRVKDEYVAECGFQRHRASNDAKILQHTFLRTQQLTKTS